jgi:hypothetical protein
METNSFIRLIYFLLLPTFPNVFVRSASALPNKRMEDDEVLAILARQVELIIRDVP